MVKPLRAASINGRTACVKLFVDRYGLAILTAGFESCSPLEMAAAEGHLDTVRLIVEAGGRSVVELADKCEKIRLDRLMPLEAGKILNRGHQSKEVEDYMNEWRAAHKLTTTTSALSTMSAQLTSITMPTSTEETSSRMEEARSSEDKTRYISGKLVIVQKMSTSTESPTVETSTAKKKERSVGQSTSNNTNNQNCTTVLLTDSGKICTKF